MANAYAPTPRAIIMYPSWLTVEYASTRLMSFITSPMDAANMAVNAPTIATTVIISLRCLEHWEEPRHQEDPRGDHRRGVDQRADRCRTLHCVR